jgi:lipoprotein Spr
MRTILITILFLLPLLGLAQRSGKPRFIEDIVVAEERAGGPVTVTEKPEPATGYNKPKRDDYEKGPSGPSDQIEDISHLQFKYALITNREVESLVDDLLYDFIEDWWRTPYRMGGTTKTGVDCSGFTRELMRDVYEVQVPRTAREQYEETIRVGRDELKEGDLVFFYTGGFYISHVGVYLGNNYFVHSSTSNGVTISSLDEDYYHKHFRGGGRNPSKRTSSIAASR